MENHLSLIDHIMDTGSNIIFDLFAVFRIGIHTVGKENENEFIFWISSDGGCIVGERVVIKMIFGKYNSALDICNSNHIMKSQYYHIQN